MFSAWFLMAYTCSWVLLTMPSGESLVHLHLFVDLVLNPTDQRVDVCVGELSDAVAAFH